MELRSIRKRRNMTVKRLAALLGVAPSSVYAWECGQNDMPLAMACAVADALRCSLDELAGRETPGMTDDARAVLDLYANADGTGRAAIRAVADAMGRTDADAATIGVAAAGRRAV